MWKSNAVLFLIQHTFSISGVHKPSFMLLFDNVFVRTFYHKAHEKIKQVLFFENTSEQYFRFYEPYQIVLDIRQLGVKTVKGGFRRRPELIKSRQLDITVSPAHALAAPGIFKNYGLFDKCERIQSEMTIKLLELMKLSCKDGTGKWMLDIGCGHGWSLTNPVLKGFCVTAVDLDFQALGVVQHKLQCGYLSHGSVHVIRSDLSHGFCFRENIFDCAISVSFLQWLCVDKDAENLLQKFFSSLKKILKPNGVAGIQFYPRNVGDISKVITHAGNCFRGALVSDYPHIDRGRKLFLVLFSDTML